MGPSSYSPRTSSHSSHQVPGRAWGRFTLDGATDPSVYSGVIKGIRRLVTATPTIFFRVKVDMARPLDQEITAQVRGDELDDVTVCVMATLLTADPVDADVDSLREFDVIVRDGGSAVDTAGLEVTLHFDVELITV